MADKQDALEATDEIATDEMIDAACNAVPGLYRVDAMRAIEAALSAQMDAARPSTLGEQVRQAQAEMATWSSEQRASVQLQGGVKPKSNGSGE